MLKKLMKLEISRNEQRAFVLLDIAEAVADKLVIFHSRLEDSDAAEKWASFGMDLYNLRKKYGLGSDVS